MLERGFAWFRDGARGIQQPKWRVRVNDLQPGMYHVVVSAAGLSKAEASVSVEVSSVRQIGVTLQPSTLKQTINVQGAASSIRTEPIDTTFFVSR
jgi:hypothetical protein